MYATMCHPSGVLYSKHDLTQPLPAELTYPRASGAYIAGNMTSNGIVQKLWNYCNLLRDDGLSYGDYVE